MSLEVSRFHPSSLYVGAVAGAIEREIPRASAEFAPPTSLRDLMFILFKWKWRALMVLLVGFAGSVFWLWVVRESAYEVSSKILVKIGHEQTSITTGMNDQPIPVIGQRAQDVNSEIDILQNKELMGQVVDELHMDVPSPPPPYPAGLLDRIRWHVKDLTSRLREWQNELFIRLGLRPRLTYRERVLALLNDGLLVTPQKDSNVIIARMFVGVRAGGSVILNALVDKYLTYRLGLWRGQGAREFFSVQRDGGEVALSSAESALRRFEQTHEIVALQKQEEVLVATIADAEEPLRRAAIAMDESAAKLGRVSAELSRPEPNFAVLGEFPQGSFSDSVMQQLSAIERQREQLRMTELDDDVRLINVRSQFNRLLQEVVSNVSAAAGERRALYEARSAAVTNMRDELRQLHAQELEWTDLKRRVTLAEQSYVMYQGRVREATGLDELESRHIGNVVVIEHATDPVQPAGTRKLTLLSAAMAVVLLTALAWIAVSEFFDHRIYSPDLLEALVAAPTIGTIPRARGARRLCTLPELRPEAASLRS